ncbi:MAG TPA: O-antigen ligase family protein [Methylosinus sp.]|jgi:O-antigen ligase|uniref:O-antigen ligase family protein n=1 Tax=Methylosinus sp. TaxID=427 RepID=UPI002F93364F
MTNSALPKSGGEWWAVSVFVIALTLGGATTQGHWSDAIVQLAGLTLILVVALQATRSGSSASSLGPILLGVLAVAAPLTQLFPLSPRVWSSLAGRSQIYDGFIQAEIDPPWLALSLEPETTLRSCLSLVPPIAIFWSAALLGPRVRRSMSFIVLVVAILSIFLGVAQLAGGPNSTLRFYSMTNASAAVGFFANRNHYSALLYCAAALLGAWTLGAARKKDQRISVAIVLCLLLYVMLICGVVSAASRAGLLLTISAGLGFAAMSLREVERWDWPSSAHVSAFLHFLGKLSLVVVVPAVLAAALWSDEIFRMIDRFASHEPRIEIYRTTWRAASSFMPFGAGFGTFASIYQMFETPRQITPEFINRAHNDWLELWLEGGVVSMAVVGAFFVWFFAASSQVWRDSEESACDFDRRLARGSTMVIILLALHSMVDYPLRTTALSCVFALACGNLIGARKIQNSREKAMAFDGGRRITRSMRETIPKSACSFSNEKTGVSG